MDRARLDGVLAREQIEELLRVHDPVDARAAFEQLAPGDLVLLRIIALTPPSASQDPHVRHRAIAALGQVGLQHDLNTLVELARFDLDPAVRASALSSLASTGVVLTAQVMVDALDSADVVERTAAQKGLTGLAAQAGSAAVIEAVRTSGGDAQLAALEELIGAKARPARASARRRSSRTTADPRTVRKA